MRFLQRREHRLGVSLAKTPQASLLHGSAQRVANQRSGATPTQPLESGGYLSPHGRQLSAGAFDGSDDRVRPPLFGAPRRSACLTAIEQLAPLGLAERSNELPVLVAPLDLERKPES